MAREEKGRVIIVSNRLPVNVTGSKGRLKFNRSSGGLATGLGPIHDKGRSRSFNQGEASLKGRDRSIWVGWPGHVRAEDEGRVRDYFKKERFLPVFIPRRLASMYYDGFANRTIWPILHSFTTHATYSQDRWEAYKKVNEMFADEVASIAGPDDLIWIHDYHLMLVSEHLRKLLPRAQIGFFLHTPFPHYDALRLLPWHAEITKALLSCDLVGFHTYDYCQSFLGSVRRLLGYDNDIGRIVHEGRFVQADVFPMGIDFRRFVLDPGDKKMARDIRNMLGDRHELKTVLSVSRLDYTKGLPQTATAIEKLFLEYPDLKGRVVFIMIVSPSREQSKEYAELKLKLDELIGRVNSRFGTIGWTPVIYMYRNFSQSELLALYRSSDVLLNIPIRDGMNLVAKEYLASRTDNTGTLILSEMTGASRELLEALIVNPNSETEVIEAVRAAIGMTREEQIKRIAPMRKRLSEHDTNRWAHDFLKSLRSTAGESDRLSVKLVTGKVEKELLRNYRRANKPILLLDYDGTLTGFTSDPSAAAPDKGTRNIIQKLSARESAEVVILSGRERFTLDEWFGDCDITLVAEHGAWFKTRHDRAWQSVMGVSDAWKTKVKPILKLFTSRIPGSFIEEKDFSLAWHYRSSDVETSHSAARELIDTLTQFTANMDINVALGHKVVEVKCSKISKGAFFRDHLAGGGWDFVFAAGDDWTDETLFAALPENSFTIRVGVTPSYAMYNVKSYQDVIRILGQMAEQPRLISLSRQKT